MISEHRVKELFTAISLHFRGKYDFKKYQGRINSATCKVNEFWFKSIALKIFTEKDIIEFYVSNIIYKYTTTNKIETFGKSFNGRENFIIWENWKKIVEDLPSHYSTHFESLDSTLKDLIEIKEGQHPNLYGLFMSGTVGLEFIVYLKVKHIPKLYDYWIKETSDLIFLPSFINICRKYETFLKSHIK